MAYMTRADGAARIPFAVASENQPFFNRLVQQVDPRLPPAERLSAMTEFARQEIAREVASHPADHNLGVSESERIARMSLDQIWEQTASLNNFHSDAPVAPQPPAMRASYMNNSPYYAADQTYGRFQSTHSRYLYYEQKASRTQTASSFRPFDINEWDPTGYRAPALAPGAIIDDRPRYNPNPRLSNAYLFEPIRELSETEALATWYAEQVIHVLTQPCMFRPGKCGASEEVWGKAGREKDSWKRVGQANMYFSPIKPIDNFKRNPNREAFDPWHVMWKNPTSVSPRLVHFFDDLISRMKIVPAAIVSAVWYMRGLGLHEGDGEKGTIIRELLMKSYSTDDEAIERRIGLLGLLLAGKWLDDNSFLTKSWNQVSGIPIADIDQLERAALHDLHYSLHIPLSEWADHVNKSFAELLVAPERADNAYTFVLPLLDEMVTTARTNELVDPAAIRRKDLGCYDYIDERLEILYYASQLAEDRPYPTPASPTLTPVSQWFTPPAHDTDMDVAARNVSALVDEDDGMMDEDDLESEDDDEFLDYDGAARFLPTISELRRSASNSSGHSEAMASLEQWRNSVRDAGAAAPSEYEYAGSHFGDDEESVFAFTPPSPVRPAPFIAAPPMELPEGHVFIDDQVDAAARAPHCRVDSSTLRGEARDRQAPAPRQQDPGPKMIQRYRSNFKETGVYLEPGIAQVRPPTGFSHLQRQPLNPLPTMENRIQRGVIDHLNYKGPFNTCAPVPYRQSGPLGSHQYRPTLSGLY